MAGKTDETTLCCSAGEPILFPTPTPCRGEQGVEAWEPEQSPENLRAESRERADPGLWGFIGCAMGRILKSD